MAPEGPRLNWVQVFAGALAAVSSALLLSTLGVGGTIIGAALGSVAASLTTYAYSRSLTASVAQAAALAKVRSARDDLERVATDPGSDPEAGLEHADRALGRAEAQLRRTPFPLRTVLGAAALVFVTAMVSITAFELLTGRAVSTYTGGSDKGTGATVPGLNDKPSSPAPATSTPTPAPEPSSSPTIQPSPSLTPSPTLSQSPTPTPSPTPSDEPTPSSTPSETPEVTPPVIG